MKVYVIDNGGQWTHREWRVLKYLDVETRIVPNTTPFTEIEDVDGLILSGGSPNVASDTDAMGNNGEYLEKADFPVFGICAGMQFISEYFGGSLGIAEMPEFGAVDLHIMDHSDVFRGIPEHVTAWASHNDEVKTVPRGFEVTASSSACPIEAIHSVSRPIFGVQFHPEVEHTQYGEQMFKNFLDIIEEWKK